jgi:hypothetical protein
MRLPDSLRRAGHLLVRNRRRTLARFRHIAPATIPGLYLRALRLGLRDPMRGVPPDRPERLVVTLSSIPSRLGHLRGVLNSLIDQSVPADRIVLALPAYSRREQRAYPAAADLRLPRGIEVVPCEDFGPVTKLLPALAAEPRAHLVVVDDDAVYPRDFLATLLDAARRHPGCALGYRGVRLAPPRHLVDLEHVFATAIAEPVAVDILFGTWGYLLPPGTLDGAAHPRTGEAFRWTDDVWVSGQLARARVPRLVVPAVAMPVETGNSMRRSLAGGPNRSGHNDEIAIAAFAADW